MANIVAVNGGPSIEELLQRYAASKRERQYKDATLEVARQENDIKMLDGVWEAHGKDNPEYAYQITQKLVANNPRLAAYAEAYSGPYQAGPDYTYNKTLRGAQTGIVNGQEKDPLLRGALITNTKLAPGIQGALQAEGYGGKKAGEKANRVYTKVDMTAAEEQSSKDRRRGQDKSAAVGHERNAVTRGLGNSRLELDRQRLKVDKTYKEGLIRSKGGSGKLTPGDAALLRQDQMEMESLYQDIRNIESILNGGPEAIAAAREKQGIKDSWGRSDSGDDEAFRQSLEQRRNELKVLYGKAREKVMAYGQRPAEEESIFGPDGTMDVTGALGMGYGMFSPDLAGVDSGAFQIDDRDPTLSHPVDEDEAAVARAIYFNTN
jgi:hypothetical protein